jgi:hypothetical protein
MKTTQILDALNDIAALLPNDMQINVALRYEGPGALKTKIADVRRGLEELRTKLATAKKGENNA